MNKLKTVLLSVGLLSAALSAACCGGGITTPQSGFKAQGLKYVQVVGGGFALVSPANVQGAWQYDNGSAVGNTRSFGPLLCASPCPVSDGRVPARWTIIAGPFGECFGQITDPNMDVSSGNTKTAKCVVPGIIFPFSTAPAPVNLQSVPGTFAMSGGSNLDTTYGMPHVEYFDAYSGDVVGSVEATSVAGDGSALQAPSPDLSQVYSGSYNILISNRQSDGSLSYIGTSYVETYGRDFIYEPPPDPCGGGGYYEPMYYGDQMEQPVDGCY